MKLVGSSGEDYEGETLNKNQIKSFRLTGGRGPISITASALQSGNLDAAENLDSATANQFFNLHSASLIDIGNGQYEFTTTRSGVYTITFIDMDGQESSLVFVVHPRIAFTSTQQQSTAGNPVKVYLSLDDDPVEYPVSFHIAVENASFAQSLVNDLSYQINQGRKLHFTITPVANSGQIIFRLDNQDISNVTLGGLLEHKVSLVNSSQLPLNLRLTSQQQGEEKTLVRTADGLVQLTSSLTGSQYIYDWSGSDPALQIGSATNSQVNTNPATLNGVYLVKLKVTERNSPNRSLTTELYLRVLAEIPEVYEVFTDAEKPYRLPICIEGGMNRVGACNNELQAIYMETLDDYQLRLGLASDFASWRDSEFALSIEPGDIVNIDGKSLPNQIDREYTHLGYRVDFELTGLVQVGQSAPIVVPLKPGLVIPVNAVWRKYHNDSWKVFVTDAANTIASAKRQVDGLCPWAGSDLWINGLNPGDNCVRLVIQDGGPNDADNQADGVIRDPSTLAVKGQQVSVTTVGKGGGGGGTLSMGWLICLCLMTIFLGSGNKKIRRIINE